MNPDAEIAALWAMLCRVLETHPKRASALASIDALIAAAQVNHEHGAPFSDPLLEALQRRRAQLG